MAKKKQKETRAQKRLRDVRLAHIAGEVPLTHTFGRNLKLPKSLRRTKGGAAEPAGKKTKKKASGEFWDGS